MPALAAEAADIDRLRGVHVTERTGADFDLIARFPHNYDLHLLAEFGALVLTKSLQLLEEPTRVLVSLPSEKTGRAFEHAFLKLRQLDGVIGGMRESVIHRSLHLNPG